MISFAQCPPLALKLQHQVPSHLQFPSGAYPEDQEIASCAYLIWEQEGRPSGREKQHWEQARAQLIACREHDQWMASWRTLLPCIAPQSQEPKARQEPKTACALAMASEAQSLP